ncbi:MAG TPA: HAD family hydrolase [Candidatus Baltobacteraceae bacterium]|nr:HAD family hydrolase [Candidatus Baltobacteraceae bacterium]
MIAIGFDFDHTLGLDNGLEREAFYAYAEELGRPLDRDDESLRAEIDDLLALVRADAIGIDEMVQRFGARAGAPHANGSRWRETCYALVDRLVVPVEGARETLLALRRRGVPLAVLTNGWTPLQQKKIAHALGEGIVGTILVSDALRALKPARAAFDALVAALGVPRTHVWYVGDNVVGDVVGALQAGLRAVWFDSDGTSYPQDLPRPTLRITDLRELATLAENASDP